MSFFVALSSRRVVLRGVRTVLGALLGFLVVACGRTTPHVPAPVRVRLTGEVADDSATTHCAGRIQDCVGQLVPIGNRSTLVNSIGGQLTLPDALLPDVVFMSDEPWFSWETLERAAGRVDDELASAGLEQLAHSPRQYSTYRDNGVVTGIRIGFVCGDTVEERREDFYRQSLRQTNFNSCDGELFFDVRNDCVVVVRGARASIIRNTRCDIIAHRLP